MKYICVSTKCGDYEYSDEISIGKTYDCSWPTITSHGTKCYTFLNDNDFTSYWRKEDFNLCFITLDDFREKRLNQLGI